MGRSPFLIIYIFIYILASGDRLFYCVRGVLRTLYLRLRSLHLRVTVTPFTETVYKYLTAVTVSAMIVFMGGVA